MNSKRSKKAAQNVRGAALSEMAAVLCLLLVLCIGAVKILGKKNECNMHGAGQRMDNSNNVWEWVPAQQKCCQKVSSGFGFSYTNCR